MGNIFDKYKSTPTASIKKIMDEEDAATNFNKRSDRLELADGLNKIRFGPKHPGEENFMHIHACHWIDVEKDDGEMGRRTVPNARLHLGGITDPVEAYVDFCKTKLVSGSREDTEKLKTLTDYEKGLNLSTTWMSYAKIIKGEKRGPWEIYEYKRSVRDALKSAMIIEDEDSAIETDPFTDPRTGRAVLITKNLKAKSPKDKYKVQTTEKKSPLTEEEMLAYDKLKPISQLSELNYRMDDYELAVQGIQNWDEENDANLFDDEEFQTILKGIKKQIKNAVVGKSTTTSTEDVDDDEPSEDLPFDEDDNPKGKKVVAGKIKSSRNNGVTKGKPEPGEDDDEPEEKPKKKPIAKKVAEPEPEEDDNEPEETTDGESDKFTDMDRNDLRIYKAKHKLEVTLYKSDTDDEIRDKLREAEQNSDVDEPEAAEEDDDEVTTKKTTAKSGKITLDDIKKKLKK